MYNHFFPPVLGDANKISYGLSYVSDSVCVLPFPRLEVLLDKNF